MGCFCISSSLFPFPFNPTPPLKTPHIKTPTKLRPSSPPLFSSSSSSSSSDPLFVLELAESLEDSLSLSSSPLSPPLQKLRDSSSLSLLSKPKPWPSSKDEPFRFTDTSFLKKSQIRPVSTHSHPSIPSPLNDPDALFADLAIVDGIVAPPSPSNLNSLPNGVFVGSIADAPDSLAERVFELIAEFPDGDLFWDLNGIGAPDVAVIYVPAGCRVERPLQLGFFSLEGGDGGLNGFAMSNPRALVLVDEGGEIGIVEEHSGCGVEDENKRYWANSVMEIVIGEGAKVRHSYIQRQAKNAAHIKWTFVRQGACSTYEIVESSTGGKLSRHNLHIQQVGPETVTEMSTFHLCGSNQTQDLHSRLVLDHPRGYSRQLHKCIVAHSTGHAVFDGNIKVNRYAQQTDAGQLTRSLLLVPRATVNVKPNLQIIADDVKCSHGAAISDLEEDQLFYFRTRGVDLQTARNALIFSFGADVTDRLPSEPVRKRVESHVRGLLAAEGLPVNG